MVHKSEIKVSDEQAQEILDQLNKDLVLEDIIEVDHGIINAIFFLVTDKGDYVIRIANPKWESYKITKEKTIFNFLHEHTTIPVPRVLISDVTKKIIPYTYNVWEKIEGENLKKHFQTLSSEEKIKVFEQLADFNIQLSKISFDSFGGLNEVDSTLGVVPLGDIQSMVDSSVASPGPFSTWKEFFTNILNCHLYQLLDSEFAKYEPTFRSFYEKNLELLDSSIPALFLHADFGLHNVLAQGSQLTALLDFEWTQSGDAEYGLAQFEHSLDDEHLPFYHKYLEAYTKVFPLSKVYPQKRILYRLHRTIIGMCCYEGMIKGKSEEWKQAKYDKLIDLSKSLFEEFEEINK